MTNNMRLIFTICLLTFTNIIFGQIVSGNY